jgi:hypothetical protein
MQRTKRAQRKRADVEIGLRVPVNPLLVLVYVVDLVSVLRTRYGKALVSLDANGGT